MKAFEMSSFHVYFLYFRPNSYSMLKGCVHHSRYIFLTYALFPFKAQRYIIVLNLKSSWILKCANPPRIILDDTQLDPRVEAITYLKWDCYPQVDVFRPPQRTTSETVVTPGCGGLNTFIVECKLYKEKYRNMVTKYKPNSFPFTFQNA